MYLNIRIHKRIVGVIVLILAAVIGLGICCLRPPVQSTAVRPDEGIEVPILMYHGILKDKKLQGKYVISPDLFESDLKYLKDHGYNTIVMQDLIDYTHGGSLPEKPIMITFDDGYYNNYLYAFPLLKQYESKMVFSPIGRYADQYSEHPDTRASYAHANWDMINEMIRSGYVEVQNHSYNMHANTKERNGAKKKKGESIETYKKVLTDDVTLAQNTIKQHTGWTPTTFTYPFGAISDVSLDILKEMGFEATLTCASKSNYITRDPECLYGLNRFLRPNGISSEQYFANILG
ncbi:MAG: polysaccharide deacetylase family protein [Clostridiales bacterium]|jgi:peptidoglycan/xylan/chitin deacetylase (PgdA/CDA1 family)|nr:polysaccharide deacetylase family protein [Clostridiales bacterium]